MKKFFSILALGIAMATSASAQQSLVYESNGFWDNWSLGVDGGINTNLHRWDNGGGVLGVQLTKGITPILSLEFSTQLGFDDTAWDGDATSWGLAGNRNHVSSVNVLGTTKVNLSNWFGGYQGQPRVFEVQARGGIGYLRYTDVKPKNSALGKVGLDFDFNLGEHRAWTLSLRPAVLWDAVKYADFKAGRHAQAQLTAGVTYHFKNHTGEHYIVGARGYDQDEVDALNARIAALRRESADKDGRIQYLQGELAKKPKEVKVVETRVETRPETQTVVRTETKTERSLECYVYFGQGKTSVSTDQMPNVERIATFLKNNRGSRVTIRGYASPEGNAEINERLARERAESVEKLLINKYRISSSRIKAEGQGVGNSFSEPDWNRVSICTIEQD